MVNARPASCAPQGVYPGIYAAFALSHPVERGAAGLLADNHI